MPTITKNELIEVIAETTGLPKPKVKSVVQLFLDQVIKELTKGNRLEFRDFGVFESKSRAARIAQNPKTLQRVEVPARRTVKFKPGRLMKELMVNKESKGAPASPAASVEVKPVGKARGAIGS